MGSFRSRTKNERKLDFIFSLCLKIKVTACKKIMTLANKVCSGVRIKLFGQREDL